MRGCPRRCGEPGADDVGSLYVRPNWRLWKVVGYCDPRSSERKGERRELAALGGVTVRKNSYAPPLGAVTQYPGRMRAWFASDHVRYSSLHHLGFMYKYNRAPIASEDFPLHGISVRPNQWEPFEKTLARFKKEVSRSAILAEYRARQHHSPRGERRRSKRNRALRRRRRSGETI